MNSENGTIAVLGVPIAFKAGADTSRIRDAAAFVEKRYVNQVQRSRGGQEKNVLLTLMAIGLADELLQIQKQRAEDESRLRELLSKIEEAKN